jgi:membrane protein
MSLKRAETFRTVASLFSETVDNYTENGCSLWAAALAYYGLFSIFPLLLFLIYLGSQIFTTGNISMLLDRLLTESLPIDIENVTRIMDQALTSRGSIGLLGGLGLLWSASAVFAVLEGALNTIWKGKARPFWGRRLLASVSILILSLAFVATLTVGPLISLLGSAAPFSGIQSFSGLLNFALIVLTSFLLYRTFPNRRVPQLPALAGALFSSLLLVLARYLIDIYLESAFINYGAVYGSLSWILYLALWTYIVGTLFLFGAEFGATLARNKVFANWKLG